MLDSNWIIPTWPDKPANVQAFITTRDGGVSIGPWQSFNPAAHVGDDPLAVAQNRKILAEAMPNTAPLVFVEQVHGVKLLVAGKVGQADAVYSKSPNQVCMVMTADCLPVFFAALDGSQVAVAHAGWRGLAAGVLEQTLSAFASKPVTAFLGPAIGPSAFEVGEEVRQAFIEASPNIPEIASAFASSKPGHFFCDLYQIARLRLFEAGIDSVSGGDFCTFKEPRFFSYRRDGICGRMVSVIYISD